MSDFDCLSSGEVRAIPALLAHPTVTAAAKALGIGESTLRRYLAKPLFKQALAQARQEVWDEAYARIQAGTLDAVNALLEIAQNPDASDGDRIRAATAILGYTLPNPN
jgi:hypothetical protein